MAASSSTLNHVRITGARTMSRDEDLELEKELARLNKPAITTIQTVIGETYDCVDFYQQPAFDNPRLKNHNFKPPESTSKDSPTLLRKIWKNGKGCPTGSVPIKRTTKDDLIRGRLASELYSSRFNPQTGEKPGLHFAMLRTVKTWGMDNKFRGGSMTTSIHWPPVVGDQHSASRIKLQNGADTIEAGWMVNPAAFNDTLTRLYVYTNVGENRCFNTLCNGFVLADPAIPISLTFPDVSKPGGPTYTFEVSIQQNGDTLNWDLLVGGYGVETHIAGFWPNEGLGALEGSAAYIDWGGQVLSHPDVPTPPMGAGLHFQTGAYDTDAFCMDVTYTGEDYKKRKADRNVVEPFADLSSDFYTIDDLGLGDNRWMYFGGPGGFKGN